MKRLAYILWFLGLAAVCGAQTFPTFNNYTRLIQPNRNTPANAYGTTPVYPLTAISATGPVNAQTTLTFPTVPAAMNLYVCYLGFNASQDATSSANTNLQVTSLGFRAFRINYSLDAVPNTSYDWSAYWGSPGDGCPKLHLASSNPNVVTVTSPNAVADTAFTLYATYYVAP